MTDDWTRRAEREAVAILDGIGMRMTPVLRRDTLVDLLALAWMQGALLGSHETLAALEVGFEEMQARL